LPKLKGILYIEDDENLKEYNWVLDNGQSFKFRCCSWNGNKFDRHSISYLKKKPVQVVIHETDYIYDIVCNFRFHYAKKGGDYLGVGLCECIPSDDDCVVNKSVVDIGP
jgi:hypothetical protein